MLPIKSNEPENICLTFEKEEKPSKSQAALMKITPSDPAHQRLSVEVLSFYRKTVEFRVFLPKEKQKLRAHESSEKQKLWHL